MVLTDSAGNLYRVHFRHVDLRETIEVKPGVLKREPRMVKLQYSWKPVTHKTECLIHKGPCKVEGTKGPCVAKNAMPGVSICSALDNFQRAAGRADAFKRAVSWLPAGVRESLLQVYFQDPHNQPKKQGRSKHTQQ